MRADPRAAIGAQAGVDFKPATAPSASTPATRSTRSRRIIKIVSGEDAADPRARRRRSTARSSTAGVHQRAVDQGRRGREGDREHAARPQHRADERARDDIPSAGHPTRATCSPPPAPSGTSCKFRPGLVGGHCIGVDPYYLTAQGRAGRLPPASHPRRAPHQRRHGRLSSPSALVKMLARSGRAGDEAAGRRSSASPSRRTCPTSATAGLSILSRAARIRDRADGS